MSTPAPTGFIAAPSADRADLTDPAVYFRREFTVAPGLRHAELAVTAVGVVEAHLDGVVVGDEVLAPGWTSYRHRLAVSRHDVTDRLAPGAHALGAIVGQGWALGRLGWEGRSHLYADRPALYVELVLDYGDRVERIVGDDAFRTGTGGVRANSIYDGEDHDERLEPAGWDRPGFDDADWAPAAAFDWDPATLFDRTAEPIRRIEELAPAGTTVRADGAVIVDFGQNISGRLRLRARGGAAGQTITLRHAELLTPDGALETETLRTARATDRWTLAGPQETEWEPRFTFHGFRYAEISGYPGTLDPSDVRAVVVHSDMRRVGWFSCSNELVNRLHENTVWSMRDNFVGLPTDCPQRDERLGWTGDIHAFAPTAVFLHDVRGVLGSWLADLAAEQSVAGSVPWIVPDVMTTPSTPTALWSDVAVGLPWVLYREYGDPAILERAYPSMAAFVDQVAARLDEADLWSGGHQFGDWLDPDAPMDNPAGGKTDRYLVAAAYLCRTVVQMADAAAVLERAEDELRFRELARRVRTAFRREYVTASGRVVNETVTAYALAICFDILDDDQLGRAGNRLADLVAATGYTISTGFAGTPLVADALTRAGQLETAYLLLTQTECPSFLYPVTQGATTVWERWDSVRADGSVNPSGMTSLNHYAFGAIASWLHRVVAGLTATEPGWRRIRIAPQPGGGLTRAQAEHDTVLGRVASWWSIADRELTLEATVPDGAVAQVVLPLHPDGTTVDVGPGVHRWSYRLAEDYGVRAVFTMDSPLGQVGRDRATWARVNRVLTTHLPGIPIDPTSPEADGMSLGMILQYIPGVTDELRADLEHALTDARVGEGTVGGTTR